MASATSLRLSPLAGAATPSAPYHSGSTLRFAGSTVLRDRRSLFRRTIAKVASSVVAYPHDDLSPGAIADASIDKVLRVEMTRPVTADAMRSVLLLAYAREGESSSELDALLDAWTFDLQRHDVILIGYDGWQEVTTFIPPHLGQIDVAGIPFMRATWHVFVAPARYRGFLV